MLLQGSMIPKPRFLQKRISEVPIGTFRHIATVQESASVYDALTIFVERRVSALPVINEQGTHRHANTPAHPKSSQLMVEAGQVMQLHHPSLVLSLCR